ncbi:MAG: GNAT family N-acetyltransferase [Candidatus Marinimicrobia bacterium]|nr:GNAT family N-acetyltransferase [Candidatus Neomarinimicrobiota bacterium]MBL7023098.1 GNAT family N-acetyltransferase [Candidatus Neomarinimicrobiota bacterium]MBL7109118.1 GNAT family N-acetyltransferase [Candidatus Neomarinimicrobiota bacterium]
MKIITPKTKIEFEEYYNLRWRILRKPWNQPRGSEIDDNESVCLHRMIVDDSGKVIAVGRLHFVEDSIAQIRWMAVDEKFQKNGYGSKLLKELEKLAKENGAKNIILQAREIALDFYYRHGYTINEKTHLLFDSIQHYKLQKTINK